MRTKKEITIDINISESQTRHLHRELDSIRQIENSIDKHNSMVLSVATLKKAIDKEFKNSKPSLKAKQLIAENRQLEELNEELIKDNKEQAKIINDNRKRIRELEESEETILFEDLDYVVVDVGVVNIYKCVNCGKSLINKRHHFCPNCGIKIIH